MKIIKLTPKQQEYPELLRNIASPPKLLFCQGAAVSSLLAKPAVAIVGSRKVSGYGQQVTEKLVSALVSFDVVIVSGLALGVDAIAHQAAIKAGGKTIAVLPSGLDDIYPSTNRVLAQNILKSGGCLISEYPAGTEPFPSNFVARNRIVSGLANALIITEAAEKSGSLHTAKFALEQGREVGAVPGSIYNPTSAGTNNLIKAGAALITSAEDVLNLLGLSDKPRPKPEIIANSKEEYILMTLINDGINDSEELLKLSGLDLAIFNQTLTMLEISGKAKVSAGQWYLQ